MNLEHDLKKLLPWAKIYPSSLSITPEGQALMLHRQGKDLLAVSGSLRELFEGTDEGEVRICPLTHKNRLALNYAFPHTAPRAFGRNIPTFGFGDRLGYANPMQLASLEGTGFLPVLAQQSMRELSLMGRSYKQVIDTASWAVFRQGWTQGFAADGDHLKTLEEVKFALAAGCTMITLDCSLVMCLPPDCAPGRGHWPADYLQNSAVEELGLRFDDDILEQLEQIYIGAFVLTRDVVEQAIKPACRPISLELSVDETEQLTSPEAHYYIANELRRADVEITSLAPRFVGEFHKAVDYIGNPDDFAAQLRRHASIADYFGHKLSLHSASEKYSVFPAFARETRGRCHVKTSGTSWLEAVECIAKQAPSLYRDMHAKALECFEDAKKLYMVHCDPGRIPALDTLSDSQLPTLLEMSSGDSRQLMHITYGFILDERDLSERLYAFMEKHRSFYEAEALDLYRRHLELLK